MSSSIDLSDITDILKPIGRYLKGAKDQKITRRERRRLERALEELAELGSDEFETKIAEDAEFARDAWRAGKRILQLSLLLELLDGEF